MMKKFPSGMVHGTKNPRSPYTSIAFSPSQIFKMGVLKRCVINKLLIGILEGMLRSIEIQQWSKLKTLLPSLNSSQDADIPKWKLNNDGQMTVASIKEVIHNMEQRDDSNTSTQTP